jgi:hypothetical protein
MEHVIGQVLAVNVSEKRGEIKHNINQFYQREFWSGNGCTLVALASPGKPSLPLQF